MRINIQEINDVTLLELDGPLAGSSSICLADVVSKSVSAGKTKFVIDMEHVTFVDSSGLGALVVALKAVQQYSGQIRIASLGLQVYLIFELTRLNRLFEICPDKREAMRSFDLPPEKFWRSRSTLISSASKLAV